MSTWAPGTNPKPVMFKVKLPALTEVGEMAAKAGVGFRSVMALAEELVLSATLVAVTEIVFGEGTDEGAV
jgi:hypothetical protein